MNKRFAVAVLLFPLIAALSAFRTAPERVAGDDRILWEKSWKEAVKRAKAESRPIMIHFNMDDEPACRNMARDHFKNDKVIALSKQFVCVLGSLGEHGDEDVFPGTDGECRRFGTVTCAEHRQTESEARADIMQTDTVTAPQFVFATPEGKVLVRRPWDLPSSELIELMNRALYYYNPDLSPEEAAKRDKEALAQLLEEGASDNAATRKKALDSLAKRDDPEIIEFLIGQTSPDVDEVKRNEAVRAIGEARNPNCLPCLMGLITDRSTMLRKNTLIALMKLGLRECVGAIVKAYGVENSERNQALMARTVTVCDPEGVEARKFLKKAIGSRRELVRAHSVRALLDVKMNDGELDKIASLAKGDTDTTVRAVSCYVGTTVALRLRQLGDLSGPNSFFPEPEKMQKTVETKLVAALKKVAAGDRSPELRSYAEVCLKVVQGDQDADHIGGVLEFFDEDEIFEDEENGRNNKNRGGRGGRGGGRGGGRR
ncbi:MAG: HEAT repeat domain-containing protein [Planctomycetes bacterium]|nr:HEAT repeat domain-containing protein [Planctomycetota bacterium]